LAQGFLAALLQNDGGTLSVGTLGVGTLGVGTLAGKLRLVASASSALDLVDTFTLLGDPATRLNLTLLPWPNAVYLPVTQR